MSRTGWILLALAAGALGGLALRMTGAIHLADLVAPVGTLWLNALRMTLVPLVFCLMTTGVASIANTAGGGRLIGTTVAVFIVLLLAASILGALTGLGVGALWPQHPVGAALAADASAAATPAAAGLFGARLFGVHPGAAQIALACGVAVLTNIGVMGLPGAAVLLAAYGPVFIALGAPLEALPLLIAVFTVPDIIDTSANVTADLAVTALTSRWTRQAGDQ